MKKNKYWIVEHYDSTELVSEYKINYGCMTEKQMENLLKTFVVKYSMNDEETINSFVKKNTKAYTGFLEISKSSPPFSISCGDNPYFIARVVEE